MELLSSLAEETGGPGDTPPGVLERLQIQPSKGENFSKITSLMLDAINEKILHNKWGEEILTPQQLSRVIYRTEGDSVFFRHPMVGTMAYELTGEALKSKGLTAADVVKFLRAAGAHLQAT